MHRQVEPIDDGGDGEAIKSLHETFEDFFIVEHQALITEVEVLSHISRLMVATEEEIVSWSSQFQAKKVQGDLGPVIASVNIITKEENLVGCLFGAALEFAQHGD